MHAGPDLPIGDVVRLPDHLKWFSRTFCFSKRYGGIISWAHQEGANGHLYRLGIETKNQKYSENLKSAAWFQLIDLFLAITLYSPVWHSHCTKASFSVLMWYSYELAVLCPLLQTHVATLRAHCSTVALCFLTITWQRIFKGSLQVTVAKAFCRMWVLTSVIFGRWHRRCQEGPVSYPPIFGISIHFVLWVAASHTKYCRSPKIKHFGSQNKFGLATLLQGDAARQWLLITVRHLVLHCVKRSRGEAVAMLPLPQVWKIHYSVRFWVWPACLSE